MAAFPPWHLKHGRLLPLRLGYSCRGTADTPLRFTKLVGWEGGCWREANLGSFKTSPLLCTECEVGPLPGDSFSQGCVADLILKGEGRSLSHTQTCSFKGRAIQIKCPHLFLKGESHPIKHFSCFNQDILTHLKTHNCLHKEVHVGTPTDRLSSKSDSIKSWNY